MRPARTTVAVAAGYLLGGIPFANLVTRATRGVDLRRFGTGTVSGTGVYRVGGAGMMVGAGLLDVAKGAAGVGLARRLTAADALAPALTCGAIVAGHNWSPYLGGAGGRGIAPAMGALAVQAPVGFPVLLAGLAGGKAAGETAIGALASYAVLVPVLRRVHGERAALAGRLIVTAMLAKRLAGNRRPPVDAEVLLARLVLDRDTWSKAEQTEVEEQLP